MNITLAKAQSIPNQPSRYPYSIVRGGRATAPAATPDDATLQNRLLAGLPDSQLNALLPHLERFEMRAGEVICQCGNRLQHAYFPATSIVSLTYDLEDGASAEMAIVGNEGMVGVGLFLAGDTMQGMVRVQSGGYGYRLNSRILKEEFDRSRPMRDALLGYVQALMVEMAQRAVCSRHHSIREQLCRCLLSTLDRSAGNELALTHEIIAASLGVRRECVTVAAGKLRTDGLIEYSRGHVTVVDREGLEAASCECYEVVKQSFDRLLPDMAAPGYGVGDDGRSFGRSHSRDSSEGLRINYLRAMK